MAYQQRLIEEQAELDGRISRLRDFCQSEESAFSTLPAVEQLELAHQLEIMRIYNRILVRRIQRMDAPTCV